MTNIRVCNLAPEAGLNHIKELLDPNKPFHILAHSMGSIVALEIVSRLEKLGYLGTITCIDGSPAFMREVMQLVVKGEDSDSSIENMSIATVSKSQLSDMETEEIMKKIYTCTTLEEKLRLVISNMKFGDHYPESLFINLVAATVKRIKANRDYNPDVGKLKSKAFLFKPVSVSVKMDALDYELTKYFDKPVEIKVLDGTHNTILQNKRLAEIVMQNILSYTKFA